MDYPHWVDRSEATSHTMRQVLSLPLFPFPSPVINATIVGFIPFTSVGMPSGEGKYVLAHETHPAVTSILTLTI